MKIICKMGNKALVLLVLFSSCHEAEITDPSTEIFSFHTSLNDSKKAHDRYEDLVVKLDAGQLEFRKDNAYSPVWRVGNTAYALQDLYAGREDDVNAKYAYARVLEEDEDQVIVHYKHHPILSGIIGSIDENPLYEGGITSVVHEIFTIRRDYSISRVIKDATGTRYQDWVHPEFGSAQEIMLLASGVAHGELIKGKTAPIYPRPPVEGSAVRSNDFANTVMSWNFDDGMSPHEDHVLERVSKTQSVIDGLSTHYEKGISGTALAFDGYYTSVRMAANEVPKLSSSFSITGWIAPDAYPYNQAPIIHQSKKWGQEGFYLGIDAYGYILLKVGDTEVKSQTKVDFGKWTMVTATIEEDKVNLFLNGEMDVANSLETSFKQIASPLQIGMNNELGRASDYVRSVEQNIGYYVGFQGLIDELNIVQGAIKADEVKALYDLSRPEDFESSLALSVLPGKQEKKEFGAYYADLGLNAIWNNLWRNIDKSDIAVEFEDTGGSVKFWKGTNYASNWITENNIWMADQSTETWGPHGCSEHMADKQNRQTFARIIENSPARAIIHWKYPCVDIGYINNNDETNWSDEYYYIYPDGTAVRKVNFNGRGGENPDEEDEEEEMEEEEEFEEEDEEEPLEEGWAEFQRATEAWVEKMEKIRDTYYHPQNNTWTEENEGWGGPGFQDVQILVAPGLEALDLVGMNAMDVANVKGDVQKLTWEMPNKTPFVQIHDASIELVKTKSEYRTFEIFQGGYITPWGLAENSPYTNDPFAGPWNHWPVNLLPSDGRYAVSNDRIGHFALGGNDALPDVGAMVLHGMTNKGIETLIPLAKSWKTPPLVNVIKGADNAYYLKEQKSFMISASADEIDLEINASAESPVVNPSFVVSNWSDQGRVKVTVNGKIIDEKNIRFGYERDAEGQLQLVFWVRFQSKEHLLVSIGKVN